MFIAFFKSYWVDNVLQIEGRTDIGDDTTSMAIKTGLGGGIKSINCTYIMFLSLTSCSCGIFFIWQGTTIIVHNRTGHFRELKVRELFGQYGKTKFQKGTRCVRITFTSSEVADKAIQEQNGKVSISVTIHIVKPAVCNLILGKWEWFLMTNDEAKLVVSCGS